MASRQCYFGFVREKLNLEDDPFVVTIPRERVPVVFVECPQFEEMREPGSRILLAKRGMGKTFMCMMLELSLSKGEEEKPSGKLRKPENLVVGINLPRVGAALCSRPELARGGASYLSPDVLTQRVFNAYWEEIRNPQKADAYERLRSKRAKMEALRWFYCQYPPDRLLSADDDPEFALWLTQDMPQGPFSTQYNLILPLEEALRLIIDSEIGAYERVYILVDGTETLSPRALERLLEDAQVLYGMRLPGLELKIFLEYEWKGQVGAILDGVRTGEIEVVKITEWTEERLWELLRRRVYAVARDQHYTEQLEEYCLDNLLCGFSSYANPRTRPIESEIAKSSQGSPRHALRLARALLSKCAELCYSLPSERLRGEHVQEVIRHYWEQKPRPV